jgi:immune inhibitor A
LLARLRRLGHLEHRWYASSGDKGDTGPNFNELGGIQAGKGRSWVGKYTIQPENGGVGVFTHEL